MQSDRYHPVKTGDLPLSYSGNPGVNVSHRQGRPYIVCTPVSYVIYPWNDTVIQGYTARFEGVAADLLRAVECTGQHVAQ